MRKHPRLMRYSFYTYIAYILKDRRIKRGAISSRNFSFSCFDPSRNDDSFKWRTTCVMYTYIIHITRKSRAILAVKPKSPHHTTANCKQAGRQIALIYPLQITRESFDHETEIPALIKAMSRNFFLPFVIRGIEYISAEGSARAHDDSRGQSTHSSRVTSHLTRLSNYFSPIDILLSTPHQIPPLSLSLSVYPVCIHADTYKHTRRT